MAQAKYRLSELTLDEISLVDHPANASARVLLFKRDTSVSKDSMDMNGVKFIVGFTDKGTAEVQSVNFGKGWNDESAKKWLIVNSFRLSKFKQPVSKHGTLNFSQKEATLYKRFRIIEPGVEMLKALSADEGFNALQAAINEALQEKYPSSKDAPVYSMCAWVRDIIGDNVIYDYDGETYRCPYSVDTDIDGDMQILLGEETTVKLVYQDESGEDDIGKSEQIPAQFLFQLGQLQAGVKLYEAKVNKLRDTKRR